jgi:hypothetical protein
LLLRKCKDAPEQELLQTTHGILVGGTSHEGAGEVPVMKIMHTEAVQMSLVRILLADDFSLWQDLVRTCFKERSDTF